MLLCLAMGTKTLAGDKFNFNSGWLLSIGDDKAAKDVRLG